MNNQKLVALLIDYLIQKYEKTDNDSQKNALFSGLEDVLKQSASQFPASSESSPTSGSAGNSYQKNVQKNQAKPQTGSKPSSSGSPDFIDFSSFPNFSSKQNPAPKEVYNSNKPEKGTKNQSNNIGNKGDFPAEFDDFDF